MGQCYFALEKFKKCVEILTKGLELVPKNIKFIKLKDKAFKMLQEKV